MMDPPYVFLTMENGLGARIQNHWQLCNCIVLETREVSGMGYRLKRKGRNWNMIPPLQTLITPFPHHPLPELTKSSKICLVRGKEGNKIAEESLPNSC